MNVNWNVILAVNNARKEYVVALSRVGIYQRTNANLSVATRFQFTLNNVMMETKLILMDVITVNFNAIPFALNVVKGYAIDAKKA